MEMSEQSNFTNRANPTRPDTHPRNQLVPRPQAIVVPRRHGTILVEPSPANLVDFLTTPHQGRTLAAETVEVSGIALSTLADLARRECMDAMARFARETGFDGPPADAVKRPWIITGHQVEFYHPGVWAKVILTDTLARRCNGLAIDLLVDHDTVEHLGFAIPYWSGARLEKRMVQWAATSNLPAEFLLAPQGDQKQHWLEEIEQFPLAASDSMRDFIESWRMDSQLEYVPWMSRARRRFEQAHRIHVHHVPCGYLCSGVAWHSFVLAWIRNARIWCDSYNAALDQYRLERGITKPGRPMPDLAIARHEIELPFWIYGDHQPRQRLVLNENNGLYLTCGTHRIDVADIMTGNLVAAGETLRQRLDAADLRVRPRALTLTMFTRLLLSDLFIHGIGGALYDQMTDQIMEQLFRACPAYACASAGWLLPVAAQIDQGQTDTADTFALKWQRHHLRCNPELLVPAAQLTGVAMDLARQRRELIGRIAQSLAADRQEHRRRSSRWLQRRGDFRQLHDINRLLLARFAAQTDALDAQVAEAESVRENLLVAAWREYFLAMHPRESLESLIRAIHST